ncbi:MAG: hypothetical protein ABJH63_10685 [Rhizobiaceae bacterium]
MDGEKGLRLRIKALQDKRFLFHRRLVNEYQHVEKLVAAEQNLEGAALTKEGTRLKKDKAQANTNVSNLLKAVDKVLAKSKILPKDVGELSEFIFER